MKKDFNKWNQEQKRLDLSCRKSLLFYEREIWIIKCGINIGIEQNGDENNFVRPVLIFRKFNKKHFLGFPLNSQKKSLDFSFMLKDIHFLRFNSCVLITQIRVLDSKRLVRKLGKLTTNVFKAIRKKSARIIFRASGAEWQ